jgi:hypothetical protein
MHSLGLEVNDPDAPGGHNLHVGLSPPPVEVVALGWRFELRGAGGEGGEGGEGGWRHGGARGNQVGQQLDAALGLAARRRRLVLLLEHGVVLVALAVARLWFLLGNPVLVQSGGWTS